MGVMRHTARPYLIIAGLVAAASPIASAQEPAVLGSQRTAVILANFQDAAVQPLTSEEIQGAIFDSPVSVNAFLREMSFGKAWLDRKAIVGWYTLPLNIRDLCADGDLSNDWPVLFNLALRAADPDLDYRQIDRVLVILGDTGGTCGVTGGQAQTKLRSPIVLLMRPTGGQYLLSRTQGRGKAAFSRG